MALPCIITYRGVDYTYDEFAALLHEGKIEEAKEDFVKSIGISREDRNKQLRELGLPESESIENDKSEHTWDYLNKEANRLVDSKIVSPVKLAEDIISGEAVESDLNNIILERGALDLNKDITNFRNERNLAASNGDKLAENEAADKYFESVANLSKIHKALESGLKKAARTLSSSQLKMKEDYSIGTLQHRFEKANNNKPLSKEIIDRLDNYAVQIAELNVKIKEHEDIIKKFESESKQVAKDITKDKIAKVREKRSKLFDEWKALRTSSEGPIKHGLPFGDEDVKFVAKIALSYIDEGILTTMEVAKQLKSDIKKNLGVNLSDEQVYKILDTEVDGEKVIDKFENTGLPSKKKSLSDLAKKAEKETIEGKKESRGTKKTEEQKLKEGFLIKNTNRALNDLRIAREKIKRKVDNEEASLEYFNKTTSEKIKDGFVNVMNLPRSLMASFDFSAPLRQGLVASIAHPTSALKATKEMFSQAFSQKNFDDWLVSYKVSPEYDLAKKSGLYIADPSDLHSGLKGREETFMSNLAERIPIIGKGIKISERGYVGYLNKLRADVFKSGADDLMNHGFTFENNPEKFKAWGKFVNDATGRGELPTQKLEDMAPVLNSLFFSPRLIASRLNLLNPLYYKNMPPEVRVKAITDMAKFVGLAASVLTLANASGADVETDPRSSDFGKIKVGDTRWDILGGFHQYMRVISQVASGKKKSTATGKIMSLDPTSFPYQSRADVLGSFARTKLSPSAGAILDFAKGKDVVGMPVTVKDELYKIFTPLQLQSGLEAYDKGGYKLLLETLIPSMFGIGVQTYNSSSTENRLKKRKKITLD